ncbi:MAG: urease accessory protein UreE [Betaproteobacteria bacterium]|nr:urease accessory protein UreE [Betaproteobacteria bacterium]
MVEIKAKLKIPRSAYRLQVKGQLRLPFASRRKGRLETRLVSGEEVTLRLPLGEVLRGGDLVTASDGRVIEVIAQTEKLMNVVCASAAQLARTAWQLGCEHVPTEIAEGFLRVAADSALADKLRKSGATVTQVEAPFEPEVEAGAPHAHSHDHGHGDHDHGHRHKH